MNNTLREALEKIIEIETAPAFTEFKQNVLEIARAALASEGDGCYLRTLEEWVNDFWNNEKDFPNDGSEKSMARLRTFEMHKAIIEMQTKTKKILTPKP